MICDRNCFECKFDDCILDETDDLPPEGEAEIYIQQGDPDYKKSQEEKKKRALYAREYRKKNSGWYPAYKHQYDKSYRAKNAEKIKVRQHQWYLANKERVAETGRRWRLANPDKVAAKYQRRRLKLQKERAAKNATETKTEVI